MITVFNGNILLFASFFKFQYIAHIVRICIRHNKYCRFFVLILNFVCASRNHVPDIFIPALVCFFFSIIAKNFIN